MIANVTLKASTTATAAAFFLALSTAASAATYNGTNNPGDGTWNRPIGGGPTISALGPVNYSVQVFNVSTSGLYDFSSVQSYDGYIHVYVDNFDPLDQLTNLLAGNDDGVGFIGTSNIDDLALTSGLNYFLVTSAFAAGQVGTFENTISGVGDVSLAPIPLPAGGLLLLTGLAAAAGVGYRKAKRPQV